MGQPGRVIAVSARTLSASLAVDADAADTTLTVSDASVFDLDGGTAVIDPDDSETTLTVTYTAVSGAVVTLSEALGVDVPASSLVTPQPVTTLRIATVQLDGDDNHAPIQAVIEPSVAAHVMLALGVLDEPVSVWLENRGVAGYDDTVTRMQGYEPALNGGDLAPGSVTETKIADGSISTPKMVANFVSSLLIQADQIVGGSFLSDLSMTALLLVGDYIEIDGEASSITIYADAEHTIPLVQLRPEGSVFRGQVIADDISVLNGLVLLGLAQLETDAEFVLKAGAPNPEMGPTLAQTTLSEPWPAPPAGFQEKGITHVTGTSWRRLLVPTSGIPGGCRIQVIVDGEVDDEVTLGDVIGINEDDMRGVALRTGSGTYYTTVHNSTGWRLANFSDFDGQWYGSTSAVVFADPASQATVGIAADHVLLARVYGDVLTVRLLDPATLALVQEINLGTLPENWSRYLYGARIDDFDFGSPHLMIVAGQSSRFWSLTGSPGSYTATYVDPEKFDLGSSVGLGGGDWDGSTGQFKSVVSGQQMRVYSGWRSSVTATHVHVAYDDHDSTHHTAASPVSVFEMGAGRRFIQVTLPTLTSAADASNVYVAVDDGPVVLADLGLVSEVAEGRSYTFDPSDVSPTTQPPTSNTFAAGDPAILRTEGDEVVISGSGTIEVPTPVLDEQAANKAYIDDLISGRFRAGGVRVTFPSGDDGDDLRYTDVTFSTEMLGTPRVVVSPLDATFSTVGLDWYISNETATGFRINAYRGGPADIDFNWIAIYSPTS